MMRRQFLTTLAAGAAFSRSALSSLAAQAPRAASTVSGVKVLAFDTFGTVVDWRSSVIAEGQQLAKAKGLLVDCVWRRLQPWPDAGRFDFTATDFRDLAAQLGA